ncbi:MAG: hypothetical protein HYX97_02395 [Chloroflexi bacterium]|nr:hypothetical protein [Chloroflexota bacterium]
MKKVKVGEIAVARAGDKGDICNVTVVPYREEDYPILLKEVTVERVAKLYGPLVKDTVKRYEMPGSKILNFVMTQALSGGVSRSIALDIHGKSRGAILMDQLEIGVPDGFVPPKPGQIPSVEP